MKDVSVPRYIVDPSRVLLVLPPSRILLMSPPSSPPASIPRGLWAHNPDVMDRVLEETRGDSEIEPKILIPTGCFSLSSHRHHHSRLIPKDVAYSSTLIPN